MATRASQGRRTDDFSFTDEGEIVYFGRECTRGHVDDECGCRRSMCGVLTSKATTTMRVVERPELTEDDLADILARSLVACGWYATIRLAASEAEEQATELAKLASTFRVGALVEKRGKTFGTRLHAVE